MKKVIFIILFLICIMGSSYANDAIITNPIQAGGDLLSADTCKHDSTTLAMFTMLPMDCDGDWALVASDTDLGLSVYDDYEFFGEEMADIYWWGCDVHYDSVSGWTECDEDPMDFNIVFCPYDFSGYPDTSNIICSYTVTATHDPDPVCVLDGTYEVWEWGTSNLSPACNLVQGWIGIQGVGNGDSCVFAWYNSDEEFGYNSYQNGYTDYQQAFCFVGICGCLCLLCEMENFTPRVPRVDGVIQWDLTVTNCADPLFNIWAEIIPTNFDCNGPQYDFNLQRFLTPHLYCGQEFTDRYYYEPGIVAPNFTDVALWTYVGVGPNSYIGSCCFEFVFTSEWGRGVGNSNYWGEKGEWGERENIVIPQSTILGQNYPNPFNAETVIPFEMKNPGNVNLTIYNLAGQVVENLIDDGFTTGQHSVTWDASKYSSGVYFYKLRTDNYVTTKKMEVVK